VVHERAAQTRGGSPGAAAVAEREGVAETEGVAEWKSVADTEGVAQTETVVQAEGVTAEVIAGLGPEADALSEPNERGCYCKPGDVSCGPCERCGAPGHMRHFPGAVPVTGAWCDRCYGIVAIRHRALRVVPVAVILGLVLVVRACRG
jgi:hypothetical protein